MKITAEPRSDQWNADDFIQGPRTFTVTGVKPGTAEQKYDIVLEGSDRVWRPPLTVLRILLAAWGDEASAWVGRRATLYRDESIRFGPSAVGGIRVSHLSNIDAPLKVNLSEKRGSRKMHTVQPLTEPASSTPTISAEDIATWVDLLQQSDSLETLKRNWALATTEKVSSVPEIVAAKNARKSELGA